MLQSDRPPACRQTVRRARPAPLARPAPFCARPCTACARAPRRAPAAPRADIVWHQRRTGRAARPQPDAPSLLHRHRIVRGGRLLRHIVRHHVRGPRVRRPLCRGTQGHVPSHLPVETPVRMSRRDHR